MNPKMSAAEIIDTCDEGLLKDPFGGYAKIREERPVIRGVMPGLEPTWLVTRYDDVKKVLSDPRFVHDPANVPGTEVRNLRESVMLTRGIPAEYLKYRLGSMFEFDGAAHARLRGLVSRAFTARRVAMLRSRIVDVTDELLDRLPGLAERGGPVPVRGTVDLLAHFANPLPIIMICELVGVPEEDRPLWRGWAAVMWSAEGKGMALAWRDQVAYIQELIERRRREPAGDLTSALIRAQDEDGDRLTDTEMIAMIAIMSLAGHETTAHLISNGVAALLGHPDQLALLRENPELMPRAVHELLRFCGPTQLGRLRYATEDVEIRGVPLRRGEPVMPVLVAANRDPRAFDDPERLDITRDPDGRGETHLGFSYGAHYCLGAALARQECEVAFAALLRRFPGLGLAVSAADLEREMMPAHWRLKALPVRL